MIQNNQMPTSEEGRAASNQHGGYLLIGVIVALVVVAVGVLTSFKLAAVFAIALVGVVTFAAAADSLMAEPSRHPAQQGRARLLQPDETAG